MYISNSNGSYGGLSSFWGETDTKDTKETAFDPVRQILSLFPASIAVDSTEALIKDPKDFIPKPKQIVNAYQAMQALKRPHGAKGGRKKETKGKVYWTASGPKFSQKPVKDSKSAIKVPPPVIKLRPNVQVVRDLPLVPNLEPIEVPEAPPPKMKAEAKGKAEAQPDSSLKGFFGEATGTKSVVGLIFVLGLLFFIFRSYNKTSL